MKFLCVIIMEAFSEKLNCKKVFLNFYAPKFWESVKTKLKLHSKHGFTHSSYCEQWARARSQKLNLEFRLNHIWLFLVVLCETAKVELQPDVSQSLFYYFIVRLYPNIVMIC